MQLDFCRESLLIGCGVTRRDRIVREYVPPAPRSPRTIRVPPSMDWDRANHGVIAMRLCNTRDESQELLAQTGHIPTGHDQRVIRLTPSRRVWTSILNQPSVH